MHPTTGPRSLARRDPAAACLAALVAADVALVWALPVLTGQDLPQHLSYARILADYADPRLAFQDNFTLPAHPQPYFTAYLLLAPLIHLTSVLTATRILYSTYVIATAAGFASLVRALNAPDATAAEASAQHAPTPWTALLGAILPWNPVQCVGFLPFMLSLPAVLFAVAAAVRVGERSGQRWIPQLAIATGMTASFHLVAAACLAVFVLLYAVARRSLRGMAAAVGTVGFAGATVAVWRAFGERGLAELPTAALRDSMARHGLYDGAVRTLGIQWNSLEAKWGFVVATTLGPLSRDAKAAVAVAFAVMGAVALATRKRWTPAAGGSVARTRARFGLAIAAFTLLAAVTPAALRLPEDICLLDFRLYVLAFMFAVALVPPRWFEASIARGALALGTVAILAVWAHQLEGVAGEATAVIRLVDRLEPTDTLLALPFHDRSEYLDEDNSVTHYFPVYYTALKGGVTSLFWGKFSHHLPIGYRAGKEPARPPDWDPSKFTREQLTATSHVLVEWPDPDDGDPPLSGAERLRDELTRGFRMKGCDGRWCLYETATRSKGSFTASAEALR